jgi:tripartite-type tricarboxylate transporter receptor subunit TctC
VILGLSEVAEKLLAQGAEPEATTSDEFTALLHKDWERKRKLISNIGFKAE